MPNRIDGTRLASAQRTLDYVVSRVEPDGRFHPEYGLFAETSGYQGELAGTLAWAGHLLGRPDAIAASKQMLDRLLTRRVEGLWTLDWWVDFPHHRPAPADWEAQNKVVDARYSAAILWSLALYHHATHDDTILEPARDAITRLFQRWDFVRDRGKLMHLTPEFAALAVLLWEHALPEFEPHKEPIIEWIVSDFVATAPTDFPFLLTVRTMLLLAATGTHHLETVIQPGIEAFLAEPRWRFEHNPNDFRHIAVTEEHVNIRANTALAIGLRLFDLAAGREQYTLTPLYAYLSHWADAMQGADGGWYECRSIATGERFGRGSPSHMFPLWWILGGLSIAP